MSDKRINISANYTNLVEDGLVTLNEKGKARLKFLEKKRKNLDKLILTSLNDMEVVETDIKIIKKALNEGKQNE